MNYDTKLLKDVTEYIARGITPSYDEKGVIVINQKCIRNNNVNLESSRITNPKKKNISNEKFLRKYDVLVNSTGIGTLGRVAQIKYNIYEPITADSHVTIVRPNLNTIDGLYFGYAMINAESNITSLGEGYTGQTELSRKRLASEIEINIPNLSYQKKIASILFSIDKKIELNNQMNKNLEETGQSIFKHWFVDFEFPNENGNPYKSTNGEMVDSELGKIPEGWKLEELGSLCHISSSKRIYLKEYVDKGIPFYRSKEIILLSKNYEVNDPLFISKNRYKELLSRFGAPKEGDLLMTSVGTLGIPYIVKPIDKFYFKDGNLMWFKSFKNKLSRFYLYYWIISPMGKQKLDSIAIGSTQKALTIDSLKKVNIPLPIHDNKLVSRFNEIINPIFNEIYILNEETKNLRQIRDSLIPKLMSGKINLNIQQEALAK